MRSPAQRLAAPFANYVICNPICSSHRVSLLERPGVDVRSNLAAKGQHSQQGKDPWNRSQIPSWACTVCVASEKRLGASQPHLIMVVCTNLRLVGRGLLGAAAGRHGQSALLARAVSSGAATEQLLQHVGDPSLVKTASFVGGEWVGARDGSTLKVWRRRGATGHRLAWSAPAPAPGLFGGLCALLRAAKHTHPHSAPRPPLAGAQPCYWPGAGAGAQPQGAGH